MGDDWLTGSSGGYNYDMSPSLVFESLSQIILVGERENGNITLNLQNLIITL
jgi:hypothetical protein